MSLPSHFTSTYRLFLRTASAAVLHQPRATRNLRKLWRLTFEDAARVIRRLDNDNLPVKEVNELELWLRTWNLRIDKSLALLFTSSVSRGLPHQVTRNLSLLRNHEQSRINLRRVSKWKPDLEASAREYAPGFRDSAYILGQQQAQEAKTGLHLLQQVVRMAEGRNGISFGRLWLGRSQHH